MITKPISGDSLTIIAKWLTRRINCMNFLFDRLGDWIDNWLKTGLIDAIIKIYTGIFEDLNTQVGDIATQVGKTPEQWNSGVFSMIRNLSETVVIPVAGVILTFVVCYELIQMIIERNNMHNSDLFELFKWVFKTFVAVIILTHTFDIVMGIFEVAQKVVADSAGVIQGSLSITLDDAIDAMRTSLEAMQTFELLSFFLEALVIKLLMFAMTVAIFILVYGRMVEIYCVVSIAPLPLSTMANREWGQIGNNYLKSLFALAFQGFLILVCVAVYAVLIQTMPSGNLHLMLISRVGYTALLCFALFKTSALSKSVFSAH